MASTSALARGCKPVVLVRPQAAPRASASSIAAVASCSGRRHAPLAGPRRRPLLAPARAGGSDLLDSDTITTPSKSSEASKKKPPIYKVMLHNDSRNRREYVTQVLLKVVDGFTVEMAIACMQEAHETGVALVVACDQPQAEVYVEGLRLNGLISTMEPGH